MVSALRSEVARLQAAVDAGSTEAHGLRRVRFVVAAGATAAAASLARPLSQATQRREEELTFEVAELTAALSAAQRALEDKSGACPHLQCSLRVGS